MALKHLSNDSARSPAPRRRWWLWLLPVVLLLIAEGVARIAEPSQPSGQAQDQGLSGSNQSSRRFPPGATFGSGSGAISINSLGLRGPLPEKARIKIALLGSDCVFGSRFPEQRETLTGWLEERLSINRPTTRFQFINAGLPVASIAEAQSIVRDLLVPNEVDAVVLFLGQGTVEALLTDPVDSSGPGPLPPPATPASASVMDSFALWRMVFSSSNGAEVRPLPDKRTHLPPETVRARFKEFSFALRALVQECRSAKLGVILATEPGLMFSEGPALVTQRNAIAASLGLDLVAYTRLLSDLRGIMRALADFDPGVWFADVARDVATEKRNGEVVPAAKEEALYAPSGRGGGLSAAGTEKTARILEGVLIETKAWGHQRTATASAARNRTRE